MGLLGKIMGFEGKGKIGIKLDKPHYLSGEVVTGTVFLNAKSPIECDGVVVKASGKEKVFWEETRTRVKEGGVPETYEVEFDEKKEFFKEKITVCNFQHVLTPGEYAYPFQYQLPTGLPGSFKMKDESRSFGEVNKIRAEIKYKFKATLDVAGHFAKDLKANIEVVVYEHLHSAITPSFDKTKKSVRLMCCIPRGDVALSVSMDKSAYLPGEIAQIATSTTNDSDESIRQMRSKLVRVIDLKADGHHKRILHTVSQGNYAGVSAHSTVDQQQPIQVPANNDVVPSTKGKYICCSYHIEIECDIPYCPDIELHLPVNIIAPMILYQGWVPQQHVAFTQQQNIPIGPIYDHNQLVNEGIPQQIPLVSKQVHVQEPYGVNKMQRQGKLDANAPQIPFTPKQDEIQIPYVTLKTRHETPESGV